MRPSRPHGGHRSLKVHRLITHLAPDYLKRYGASMPRRHRQVLDKILACRTPAMGGQMFGCPDCRTFDYRYHSCNDRHCPLCGGTDARDWLQRQRARLLLPVPYFLVTFTVPEALRAFIRSHQQVGLDLLFDASARAMRDLAASRMEAQLGMLGVLHTWSRTLVYHPHIHYLVPGGGLSLDERSWIAARKKFLLPVKALGLRVRTWFKERLIKEHPELFAQVPSKVWKRHWNVDSRQAGSGENALRYLSRYVFKTATSDREVPLASDGAVLWPYRESQTGRQTSLRLEPLDWMSRFLQHILPKGFARVRTFGWLHSAGKARANRVRALLGEKPLLSADEKEAWQLDKPEADPDPAGLESSPEKVNPVCPCCRKPMRFVGAWRGRRLNLFPFGPTRPP